MSNWEKHAGHFLWNQLGGGCMVVIVAGLGVIGAAAAVVYYCFA